MPVGVTLKEIIQATPSIRTFVFDREIASRPGQFVMVWVPGVDEVPMALSSPSSITVLEVGDAGSVRERLCGHREDPCYRRRGRRIPAAAACRGRTGGYLPPRRPDSL
jgi:NAD(P)H-flavin reductase